MLEIDPPDEEKPAKTSRSSQPAAPSSTAPRSQQGRAGGAAPAVPVPPKISLFQELLHIHGSSVRISFPLRFLAIQILQELIPTGSWTPGRAMIGIHQQQQPPPNVLSLVDDDDDSAFANFDFNSAINPAAAAESLRITNEINTESQNRFRELWRALEHDEPV